MSTLAQQPNLTPRHKLTVRLSSDAYSTAQEAVELGLSPNQNAFIEDAIRLRTREVRHARMRVQAAEAMNDPVFVADMRETMQTFASSDRDSWLSETVMEITV